jgi:hypothetical protein
LMTSRTGEISGTNEMTKLRLNGKLSGAEQVTPPERTAGPPGFPG